MTNFLPVTMQELLETGVSQPDFVYITGDAYVDHPSFGAAIITRLLQSQGYSVAVLAQPDWHTVKDFTEEPLHRLTAVPLVLSGPLCPAGISPPRGESPLKGRLFQAFPPITHYK